MDLNSRTPSSGRPHLFAIGAYDVRGVLIDRDDMVAKMQFLEQVGIHFLDSLPTLDWSSVRQINRILREERRSGGSIVLVHGISMFLNDREKPLAKLRIWCVCLLGKGRQSKAEPTRRGSLLRGFSLFCPGVLGFVAERINAFSQR